MTLTCSQVLAVLSGDKAFTAFVPSRAHPLHAHIMCSFRVMGLALRTRQVMVSSPKR